MSKFKVGDEMWIHTKICITAIQEGKSGQIIYSTDKEIHIREAILEQIRSASVAPVAPQPAPKFKVGDRVATKLGNGTLLMTAEMSGNGDCLVSIDNYKSGHSGLPWSAKIGIDRERSDCYWFGECDLSPAPEPKYYSGKVFAVSSNIRPSISDVRNGHVFEIKDGLLVGETRKYQLWNLVGNPIMSFKDFCNKWYSTNWQEVKE